MMSTSSKELATRKSKLDGVMGNLPIDKIEVRKRIRSTSFGENNGTLQALSDSIAQLGVLSSLLVRPVDGRFVLVAGARRLKAAEMAGLTEVPVYCREMTDLEARALEIAENIHRK